MIKLDHSKSSIHGCLGITDDRAMELVDQIEGRAKSMTPSRMVQFISNTESLSDPEKAYSLVAVGSMLAAMAGK